MSRSWVRWSITPGFCGLFHHNLWGNEGAGGAMQVNLVSSCASLAHQAAVNQNVLTTEKPSQAPAAPSPKEQQAVDEKAIPILGKQAKPQEADHARRRSSTSLRQPQNRGRYGEQTGTIDAAGHAAANRLQRADHGGRQRFCQPVRLVCGPDQPQDGEELVQAGSRSAHAAGEHVSTWFSPSARTAAPADVQLDRSSGSPTLDRSCERGVQRVDTFRSACPRPIIKVR